jgi:hypothetical protein
VQRLIVEDAHRVCAHQLRDHCRQVPPEDVLAEDTIRLPSVAELPRDEGIPPGTPGDRIRRDPQVVLLAKEARKRLSQRRDFFLSQQAPAE